MPRKKNPDSPSNEHIFPATHLTKLALRWKELHAKKKHAEAMSILEEIIIGSTHMFERLAQHENYHYTVDLSRLTASAQEKVVKWLIAWNPKEGRLFSWFSKCAKNAFRSEVIKEGVFRSRYHVTSDNLEKFFGSVDHEIDKHEAADSVRKNIEDISVRWGDPQEIGAIRYLVECIVDTEEDDGCDKAVAIRSAAYAYGISIELSKFFYNWALMELRDQFYRRMRVPFTEQDLFRHQHSYSQLVDLLNIVSWDQLKKIIAVMGGTRLKIPTLANMARLNEAYEIWKDIEDSDKDPNSIKDIAKKRKKSVRSAQDIYYEMSETLHHNRSGEYELYTS